MTVAVFLIIEHSDSPATELVRSFCDGPLVWLGGRGEVESVDTYSPAAGDVPLFDDESPPKLLIEIDVENTADAEVLLNAEEFQTHVCDATCDGRAESISIDVFEIRHYPVPGHSEPPPRTAPLSFVVRYYGPTPDENEFAQIYTQNHPPLLALFPGIRNILCYLPVSVQLKGGLKSSGAFLGNEVVFDDLDALAEALGSDVIAEVMEDAKTFPPFGSSTHYAMVRERVYTRS